MRLAEGDEIVARDTLDAAFAAGIRVFDTARTYGESERLLGEAIRRHPMAAPLVVTKCGMLRDGATARGWKPDGRATRIASDVRASAAALGGAPIDVLLLHAPDPNVALTTSLRALVRAKDDGLVRAIGLSNVRVKDLDAARALTEIAVVEVALGAGAEDAARGGVVAWCDEHDVRLLAHGPLGGPKHAPRLARDPMLCAIAARYGATPAEIVLAYLLAVHPRIEPLLGARRPTSIASAVRAASLVLEEADLALLDGRFPGLGLVRAPPVPPSTTSKEVVIVMGIPGAGKSRLTESFVARGHARLNRDTLGGTLRGIAKRLDALLAEGTTHVVLDNTYVTRALRSEIVRLAHRHGAGVRCIFVATPLHEAQANVVHRMLDRHDELLGGPAFAARAKKDPGLVLPAALFRMERDLERPTMAEGFRALEEVPFERANAGTVAASAIPFELVARESPTEIVLRESVDAELLRIPPGPILLFAWRPGASEAWLERAHAFATMLASATARVVELGVCTHAAGPPVCWCRPPLPGLWVRFARRHGIGQTGSVVVTLAPAHRSFATALGLEALDLTGPKR